MAPEPSASERSEPVHDLTLVRHDRNRPCVPPRPCPQRESWETPSFQPTGSMVRAASGRGVPNGAGLRIGGRAQAKPLALSCVCRYHASSMSTGQTAAVRRPRQMNAVRAWVEQHPPAALIGTPEAQAAFPSASSDTLRKQLRRLAAATPRSIERLADGIYYRPGDHLAKSEALRRLAWRRAGPGAGWSGLSALNALGWASQFPVIQRIAVVGPAPPAPAVLRGLHYVSRWNPARRALNRWEITLLEAVRIFDVHGDDTHGDPWEWLYADHVSGRLLLDDGHVDTARLLAAARRERQGAVFVRRCERLAQAIETGSAARQRRRAA